jgi:hypothetical protein
MFLLLNLVAFISINKDKKILKENDVSTIINNIEKDTNTDIKTEMMTLIQELEQKSFEEFAISVDRMTPPNDYTSIHDIIYHTNVNWKGIVIGKTNNSISVLGDNKTVLYNNESFSKLINNKKYIPYIIIVDLQYGISTQELKLGKRIQVKGTLTQAGNIKKSAYWRLINSTFSTLN